MRKVEIFCCAAFAASLLFGGATQKGNSASDDLVQAVCVLALAFALPEIGRISARPGASQFSRSSR